MERRLGVVAVRKAKLIFDYVPAHGVLELPTNSCM